mmetsp:Transcript_27510/g.77798  ORF Transcript_27510/g.77798 Transcript_27510/m.77798 type:complete len:209 (-) Transcript_27510:4059-4685(-)
MPHRLLLDAILRSHGGGDAHLVGSSGVGIVVDLEGAVAHILHLRIKGVWAVKGHLKGVGVTGFGPQVLVGIHCLNDVSRWHSCTALMELIQAKHILLIKHVGGDGAGDERVHVSLGGIQTRLVWDNDAVQLHVDQVVAAHLTGEVHQIAAIIHVLNPLANCELIDLGVEMQRPDNLNGEAIPSREATAAALVVRLDAEHHALPGQTLD